MIPSGLVVLFDVDNTLFDNDRFKSDLADRLLREFGEQGSAAYWTHYEALREQHGYVDYLGALQRLRDGMDATPGLLRMSGFLLDYPFARNLYPDALAAVASVAAFATPAVFSDGDIVFQPRKIQYAGIGDAVAGRIAITVHKEQSIDAMRVRFPAAHYVMVDDKPNLLAAMKRVMGGTLTTVFVRQGHYAAEAAGKPLEPPPDRVVERIGELCGKPAEWFAEGADASARVAE